MDESYRSLLATGVEKQLRGLEMSIMEDIVRRIRKAGSITDTADWQIQRLIILGNSTQDIEGLVRDAVNGSEEKVRRIYAEVIEREYTHDRSLYEKIGKDFVPYVQNLELQQLVSALIQQSNDALYNITKSTGFMLSNGHGGKVFTPLSDIYNRYLDQAVMGLASGAYDYSTLIRRMVNEMTNSGLRTSYAFKDGGSDYGVDYASGWHSRIDVAARRALLTGMNQVASAITEMNAQRLGAQYFEVTWHAGARPDHAAWQGKVYDKEDLVRVCGLGTGAGLNGWNCRHSYYPFFPGISERTYTDEWLAKQSARENTPVSFRGKDYTTYGATQKQRQMETSLRAQREKVQLLRESDADKEDITLAQCKYQAKLEEYRSFSAAMGLPEQTERIYTGRTKGRISPSPSVMARYTPEMLRNTSVDNAMYARRQAVLGKDIPPLVEFRKMKYQDREAFARLERQYKTFLEIDSKSWNPPVKDKAKETYRRFLAAGHESSSHFLARYLSRGDEELGKIIEIMNMPPNYRQTVDGREIRWYNGIALIKNPDTNEYVTMEKKKTPKEGAWEKI